MPSGAASSSQSAPDSDALYDLRAKALNDLQASSEDWWEDLEVSVPWAAVDESMEGRRDSWQAMITDVTEEDDALDSMFTLEDGIESDTSVCLFYTNTVTGPKLKDHNANDVATHSQGALAPAPTQVQLPPTCIRQLLPLS